jgi:hypothetical protein
LGAPQREALFFAIGSAFKSPAFSASVGDFKVETIAIRKSLIAARRYAGGGFATGVSEGHGLLCGVA